MYSFLFTKYFFVFIQFQMWLVFPPHCCPSLLFFRFHSSRSRSSSRLGFGFSRWFRLRLIVVFHLFVGIRAAFFVIIVVAAAAAVVLRLWGILHLELRCQPVCASGKTRNLSGDLVELLLFDQRPKSNQTASDFCTTEFIQKPYI